MKKINGLITALVIGFLYAGCVCPQKVVETEKEAPKVAVEEVVEEPAEAAVKEVTEAEEAAEPAVKMWQK